MEQTRQHHPDVAPHQLIEHLDDQTHAAEKRCTARILSNYTLHWRRSLQEKTERSELPQGLLVALDTSRNLTTPG
jgi:hypothetical protein